MYELPNLRHQNRWSICSGFRWSVYPVFAHSVGKEFFIDLGNSLDKRKFPMNWILSNTAMGRLDSFTDSMLNPTNVNNDSLVIKFDSYNLK